MAAVQSNPTPEPSRVTVEQDAAVSSKITADFRVAFVTEMMSSRSGVFMLIQMLKKERMQGGTILRDIVRPLLEKLGLENVIQNPTEERYDFEWRASVCLKHQL